MEIKIIIKELTKALKQAHFKLVGTKLIKVKTILENYIADGYTISEFNVYRRANIHNRCQDDRHVNFNIKNEREEKSIDISIEEV